MSRDYGHYFEDRIAWWFVAGQFLYHKDPIQGLALTFDKILYDIIDFLYNDDIEPFYIELHENESNVTIPGIIEEVSNETSENLMMRYRNALLYYDWDAVLLHIVNNKDFYNARVHPYIQYFINFKSSLLEMKRNITSTYCKEQIVEAPQRLNSVLDVLKDKYNITEKHWISRVFKNHYKGSCHDILFSPLFTLVNIGKDISRHIKDISDILYSLDNLPNTSHRSILVMLKERVRTFDEIGLGVLETIYNSKESKDNKIFLINEYLMEKGIPPKHRYLLNDSLFWLCSKGCLKNTYKVYDEQEHVVNLFHAWQPFGVKLLDDFPF